MQSFLLLDTSSRKIDGKFIILFRTDHVHHMRAHEDSTIYGYSFASSDNFISYGISVGIPESLGWQIWLATAMLFVLAAL
jgi:hypothetical protein